MTPEEVQTYVDNRIDARAAEIAEAAADRALEKFYASVGHGILKKAGWLVAIIGMGLLGWLAGKGYVAP